MKRKRETEPSTTLISRAMTNAKLTLLYSTEFSTHTVKSARPIARRIGTKNWYSMKKPSLVSLIVLEEMARRIQRFVRTKGQNVRDRGLEKEFCPITMAPMSSISRRDRFFHSNSWFDRNKLVEFIRMSCDFVHPVTRVEFTREDIKRLDRSLLFLYDKKEETRSSIVSQIETIQCLENELEEIFREMIDMACVTPTRNEFNIIMTYSEFKFEECFKDLARIDRGRCIVVLKSLPGLMDRDRYARALIPKTRAKELKEFINEFMYRARNSS